MRRYFLMDMRRLFRTRGFYIAIIVSIFFLSIFALASYYVTGIAEEFVPGSERMLNPQLITQARAQMTFNFFFSFFFSLPGMRMLHMLLSLFAAGYLSKEHQSGYLKNMLSLPGMRGKWMVSKTLIMLLATLIFYAVFGLACVLVLLFYGNPVVIKLPELAPFLLGQVTVDMALYAVIMLVVMLFQSKAAAVVVALILSLNMQALLYLLIDWVGILPIKLTSYGMMNLAAKAQMPGSMSSLMSGAGMGRMTDVIGGSADPGLLLAVAGGVLIIFLLLSALSLRKADYKG